MDPYFLNINGKWVRSPLGVVEKILSPIDSSDVFSAPKEICLRELLKMTISTHSFQKVSVLLIDG